MILLPSKSDGTRMLLKCWQESFDRLKTAETGLSDTLNPEFYEAIIKEYIAEAEINTGWVMNLLRLCLVGAPMGPGVFDIMAILEMRRS